MIYGGKPLLPLRGMYVPEIPHSVDIVVLPGGPSSQRRVTATPITTISVQYLLTGCLMTQWYKAWYRRETLEGAESFTARLAIDNALYADYTVQFNAAPTIQHLGYRGLLTARYDVLSRVIDDCVDAGYVTMYTEFGDSVQCVMDALNDSI